jgi:sporulation protein YlmC with PRC-barrel domain
VEEILDVLGYQVTIVTSKWITDTKEVKRTWKERLFTVPWRPLKKTKTVVVPSDKVYMMGDIVVCHPVMESRLQEALANDLVSCGFILGLKRTNDTDSQVVRNLTP